MSKTFSAAVAISVAAGLLAASSAASARERSSYRERPSQHSTAQPLLYVHPRLYSVYPGSDVDGSVLVTGSCYVHLRAWRLSRPRYWTVHECY